VDTEENNLDMAQNIPSQKRLQIVSLRIMPARAKLKGIKPDEVAHADTVMSCPALQIFILREDKQNLLCSHSSLQQSEAGLKM